MMCTDLCPYCGGRLSQNNICSECGSSGNPNHQYFDPIEQSWQQGRFLRGFKYGRAIAAVCLVIMLYSLISVIIDIF